MRRRHPLRSCATAFLKLCSLDVRGLRRNDEQENQPPFVLARTHQNTGSCSLADMSQNKVRYPAQ